MNTYRLVLHKFMSYLCTYLAIFDDFLNNVLNAFFQKFCLLICAELSLFEIENPDITLVQEIEIHICLGFQ